MVKGESQFTESSTDDPTKRRKVPKRCQIIHQHIWFLSVFSDHHWEANTQGHQQDAVGDHLNTRKTHGNSTPGATDRHFEKYLERTSGAPRGQTTLTKRIASSSCFCFMGSRALRKQIDPSPKEIGVHFMLFSDASEKIA